MPKTVKKATSEINIIQKYLGKMGHFSAESSSGNKEMREKIASNKIECGKLARSEEKLLKEFVATKKVISLLESKANEYERKKVETRDDQRVIEELEEEIEGMKKLLEGSKLEKFKCDDYTSSMRASISLHNDQIDKFDLDISNLETAIQQASKPMQHTIFANRSVRKDHYLKANLDKYMDVLVDVHRVLKEHEE